MLYEGTELTERIIGFMIEVHRELGPGLLESTYEACLCHEFSLAGLNFRRQVGLPVSYKGMQIDCGYRIDVIVEETVIIEIKSVKALDAIHDAQIMTYLKLSKYPLGLLANFNVKLLKDGIRRKSMKLPE